MPLPKPAHLEPSELGTKQYWDNLYQTEIANHASNPDDKGTVWFDDADAEIKMVQFLGDREAEGTLADVRRVLDLGCGNGSLLRAVRDELWGQGDGGDEDDIRLLGVDYSEASVLLAQSIEAEEGGDGDGDDSPPLSFIVWDMLEGKASDLWPEGKKKEEDGWDLVLDKGTFDAISLGNAQQAAEGDGVDQVEVRYRRQVLQLLRPGGTFLITSCNWTEPELCAWMEDDEEGQAKFILAKTGRVAYPSFQFGGVQGQTVCTVCFEKRRRQ